MSAKTKGCAPKLAALHDAARAQRLATRSLKPWPAANAGTVLDEMRISLPFSGLRPLRAFLLRGRNVPKPTTVTRLPFAPLATIASNTAFTASPALDLLRLPARAAAWARSALVTDRMA